MALNLKLPEIKELKPKITVFGVGGAGGNAVNNMIRSGLQGCEFVVANTDSQALTSSRAEKIIQMGVAVTEGLGAGSQPEVGRAAAEEAIAEITDHLTGSHMVFVTAGMGGGTGTGAAPIIARTAREQGILTVGVVTKPFQFEGVRRMRVADAGIKELEACVDTLIVIPNQNLFRIANEKTTFADAFAMADQVLYSGVACITDLMVKEGLINLDFADVRSVMREMGKAMMGTGEASGERRATQAAEAAIANPLLDETSMRGARGLLISITGGKDLTLFEVDEAATRIREEVDPDANIILGATFEEALEGVIRVSVVATGIASSEQKADQRPLEARAAEQISQRLRGLAAAVNPAPAKPAPAPAMPRTAPAMPPRPAPQPMMPAAMQDPSLAAFDTDASHYGMEPETMEEGADEMDPADAPFIAPAPEAPVRIPRVEDFPPVVQRQIEARQQPQRPAHEDRGPMSLLRRLASVGLGRAHEEAPAQDRQPAPVQRPVQKPQTQQRQTPPQPRAAQPAAARTPAKDALYRPAEGNLDPHGRQQPAARAQEDELEIPAFLRRQAN
ncbi:MAG: cell division protein FtsZ [Bauldia sp.]